MSLVFDMRTIVVDEKLKVRASPHFSAIDGEVAFWFRFGFVPRRTENE
jgi:hypothetical protein